MRANPAFHRIFGYRWGEDDLVGKTVKEFSHPDDAPLAGQDEMFETEKRYVRKDGSVIWGQINVSLVRDAHGEPVYTVGHVQDITTRKQAEQNTQQERRTLQAGRASRAAWLLGVGRAIKSLALLLRAMCAHFWNDR